MLVVTCKHGQTIRIGEGVSVTVFAVSGTRVKIGVDAPPTIPIRRQELAPHQMPARKEPTPSQLATV
jgi:carbon storage regulator